MSQVHEVEVWVMVNESGEFEVGTTAEECGEKFETNCSTTEAVRKVCLKLRVPSPEALTLAGDVPPEPIGAISLTAT